MRDNGIVLTVSALLSMSIIGCGVNRIEPGRVTPEEALRTLVGPTIPASVSDVQGWGETWQGYTVYVRFTASSEDIDEIISAGFEPVAWDRIDHEFELRSNTEAFSPPWQPETVQSKECYRRSGVENDWTHDGADCLLIERSSGTVYYHGIGA